MAGSISERLENIILKLYEVEAVKFGKFILKSGIESPVYFDLRVMVSYPLVMKEVADLMWEVSREAGCDFDSVCGVPYTALPIATCISVDHKLPMLIRRKEAKDYGTKKMIEGHFKEGEKCLVIEDVVTSGGSVYETVQTLETVSIKVTDAIVLLDREQGGKTSLMNKGIKLHSVCTLSTVLEVLERHGKLDHDVVQKSKAFISQNRFDGGTGEITDGTSCKRAKLQMSHKEKSEACSHPMVKKLYSIMEEKKTNLALSADLTKCEDLLKVVDVVGPHVCIVKTHIDIVEDFTPDFTLKLSKLAQKHNFLIFEDRKFGDIGNTVKSQYGGGVYKIANWSHIVNAHPIPGPGVIAGLREVGLPLSRGCLLVAEMSSEGNLAKDEYTKAAVKMAEDNTDFMIGFICQSKLSSNLNLLHMMPGIQLSKGGDGLGQQYVTPEAAVGNKGADIIIVGRGILKATDPQVAAQDYQRAGYSAYLKTLE